MSLSVHQTSHDLLREVLRGELLAVVESEAGGGDASGSLHYRASAALYALLGAHPLDRHGRCRSCRRAGVVAGRWRRVCRVYLAARFYLRQPDDVLLCHLGAELGQPDAAPPSAADPEPTEVLPRVGADPLDMRTGHPPAPAVSPPGLPGGSSRARPPAAHHGGAGEPIPRRPRSRRAPSDDQTPAGSDMSIAMARAEAC